MASVNKVILIGHLGGVPELRHTHGGSAVAQLSVATSESWKDKSGTRQEKTEWYRVVAWGKLGETAAKYLDKGSLVYVEGRLQTRSWDDKDGNRRSTTEIVASEIRFLDRKGSRGEQRTSGQSRSSYQDDGYRGQANDEPGLDDDIPF